MQYLKDRGFIIKRINFGDSDRFITLFTRHNGKIDVVARSVRKITSRRAGSVELLNLVDFAAVRSHKNFVLTEVVLSDSFQELKRELKYIKSAFLMCELIDAALPSGVVHADIFDLVRRALAHIHEDDNTMVYFQARLLSMLGFWDRKASFRNAAHVTQITEEVIERKLKTTSVFSPGM